MREDCAQGAYGDPDPNDDGNLLSSYNIIV